MGEHFDKLKGTLKKLPGLGFRSAERIALHLCIENRQEAQGLLDSITEALLHVSACPICHGISEHNKPCAICADTSRNESLICIVEKASDVDAIERAGAWRGRYHILGGKLSPLHRIGPSDLNFETLTERIESGIVSELILALSNDMEAEATCHYIQDRIVADKKIKITRIGFGLPSGSQLGFADSGTIRSALDSRKTI